MSSKNSKRKFKAGQRIKKNNLSPRVTRGGTRL